MSKDDQKTQELQDVFSKIQTERELREWEQKNREKILESDFVTQRAFDDHWKDVAGDRYFQPVTMAPPTMPAFGRNNTERSDPKSRKYRAKESFKRIIWQKIRRKINGEEVFLFNLQGETNYEAIRPIFQNLDNKRLHDILGDKAAKQILKQAIDDIQGDIDGSFILSVEGFWEVVFAPMKSESDTKDVELHWEGQCLLIQRQKPVVLPGFYIEAADNATRDHYTHIKGQGRKKVGVIQQYPYTVMREATFDEFTEQKKAGDKIMRDKIAREEG